MQLSVATGGDSSSKAMDTSHSSVSSPSAAIVSGGPGAAATGVNPVTAAAAANCQLCSLVEQLRTFMPFMDRVDEALGLWIEARRACAALCAILYNHVPAAAMLADEEELAGLTKKITSSSWSTTTTSSPMSPSISSSISTTTAVPPRYPANMTPKLRHGITKDWQDTERTLKEMVATSLGKTLRRLDPTDAFYPGFTAIFTDKALRAPFLRRVHLGNEVIPGVTGAPASSPDASPDLRAFVHNDVRRAFEPYDKLESVLYRMFGLLLVDGGRRSSGAGLTGLGEGARNRDGEAARRDGEGTRDRDGQGAREQVAPKQQRDETDTTQVSASRTVLETIISTRGDVVLEFANSDEPNWPVYRFRVQSSMLAETSPVFAQLFSEEPTPPGGDNEDEREQHDLENEGVDGLSQETGLGKSSPASPSLMRAPSSQYDSSPSIGTGGGRFHQGQPRIYRMPQTRERNERQCVTIMLHAAHLHNDRVPRDVDFDQFVAIAEVCHRYACTGPLELIVEHRWLPAWQHRAVTASEGGDEDDLSEMKEGNVKRGVYNNQIPEGFLIISHAFGLRRLFTAVSKKAILHVEDSEAQGQRWPPGVRERVWAMRQAKMAQVLECCAEMLAEFVNPPLLAKTSKREARAGGKEDGDSHRGNDQQQGFDETEELTKRPKAEPNKKSTRCPHGSQACDAANLGWFMLTLAELEILPHIMMPQSPGLRHLPQPAKCPSLIQLFDSLKSVTTAPSSSSSASNPASGGVGGWGILGGGGPAGAVALPHHPHGGVCDFSLAFRAAVFDLYNSVQGLTLYDVSGQHGWALSKHKVDEPQSMHRLRGSTSLSVMVHGGSDKSSNVGSGDEVEDSWSGNGLWGKGKGKKQPEATDGSRGKEQLRSGHVRGEQRQEQEHEQEQAGATAGGAISRPAPHPRSQSKSQTPTTAVPSAYNCILRELDDLEDLHAAAMTNRAFYNAYKAHELDLMRGILRREERRKKARSGRQMSTTSVSSMGTPLNTTTSATVISTDKNDILETSKVLLPNGTAGAHLRNTIKPRQSPSTREGSTWLDELGEDDSNNDDYIDVGEGRGYEDRYTVSPSTNTATTTPPMGSGAARNSSGNSSGVRVSGTQQEEEGTTGVMAKLKWMGQHDRGVGAWEGAPNASTDKFFPAIAGVAEDKMRSPAEDKHLRATYDRLVGLPSAASTAESRA